MRRDARAFLWDAHSAAEAILKFVASKTYKDYSGNRLMRSTVERQFEIIGEEEKSKKGRWFSVEMQISEDYNFDKRAIYYWAKLVTEQLSEGMMLRELKKKISINILDFNFIPDTPEFHNRYKIINTATGKDDKLHDVFELHYIELRKFIKPYREITTALDRWSTFIDQSASTGQTRCAGTTARRPGDR